MGERIELTPLEYLHGGLAASDKLRIQISNLIKQEFAKSQKILEQECQKFTHLLKSIRQKQID